jgi:hypothetical protein
MNYVVDDIGFGSSIWENAKTEVLLGNHFCSRCAVECLP